MEVHGKKYKEEMERLAKDLASKYGVKVRVDINTLEQRESLRRK